MFNLHIRISDESMPKLQKIVVERDKVIAFYFKDQEAEIKQEFPSKRLCEVRVSRLMSRFGKITGKSLPVYYA